jgi:hypothetical protein
MHFYTFELGEESQDICTIATPLGVYKYKRLPMGICQSPDIAQEVMELVIRDINEFEVYSASTFGGQEWCRCEPREMRMWSIRNRLARILAHPIWIEAVAKESASYFEYASARNRNPIALLNQSVNCYYYRYLLNIASHYNPYTVHHTNRLSTLLQPSSSFKQQRFQTI